MARSGRPGPVLVDITKDAQQAHVRIRLGSRQARNCPATVRTLHTDPDDSRAPLRTDHSAPSVR